MYSSALQAMALARRGGTAAQHSWRQRKIANEISTPATGDETRYNEDFMKVTAFLPVFSVWKRLTYFLAQQ